jgi:hypothetical protein
MGPFNEGWTESDVEQVLERGDPMELLYVPIVVGMNAADLDRAWAEDVCIRLAGHSHFQVRGNALTGLGHIARTCRALDLERAVPLISAGLSDPDKTVRGLAEDAAADLEMYLGLRLPGYDGEATAQILDAVARIRREHGL